MRKLAWLVLLAVAGCGDDTTSSTADLATSSPAQDLAVQDLAVRRTADVPLGFQPAGLFWDSATQALYLANDGGDQIVRWDEDAGSFAVVARLPTIAPTSGGLGQLIKTSDGSWLVTRFGCGTGGAVIDVPKTGTIAALPGLATNRRRIGLTAASDGTLYDGSFTAAGTSCGGGGTGPMNGVVSLLTLDGKETDLITGIGKPVGVLAIGTTLYVSDQMNGVVLKATIPAGGTATAFATIAGADELAAGPAGTIFAVSNKGTVTQLATDGTPTEVGSGYKALRGVAYDSDHQRLFIGEPDAGSADGGAGMPMLHILPID
jgi:sugar lactone lactonase YvrE